MIFVTLGTQKVQMNRLLKNIDELIAEGKLNEEVLGQVGESDYVPEHYKVKKFMNSEEFSANMQKSDLVITHSGVGTIMSAVRMGKKVLVCPRMAKYGEHVDDHQMEIGVAFEKRGYVCLCSDRDSLLDKINEAQNMKVFAYSGSQGKIKELIRDFISENFN